MEKSGTAGAASYVKQRRFLMMLLKEAKFAAGWPSREKHVVEMRKPWMEKNTARTVLEKAEKAGVKVE